MRQAAMVAGRTPVVVAAGIAGLLVVVGLAIGPWLRLTQVQQELAAKAQTIAALTSQNQGLQQQLAQLEDERKELETRVAGLRSQLASATEELGKLRDLQGRYDVLQNDKTRLEVEATRLTRERNEANERLRRVEEDNHVLEQSAARLRNRLALLDRDYQQLATRLAEIERQNQTWQADPYAPITLPPTRPRSDLPASPEMPSVSLALSNQPMQWRQTSPGLGAQTTQATTGSVPPAFTTGSLPPAQPSPEPARVAPRPPAHLAEAPPTGSSAPSASARAASDELAPQTIELPPIIVRKSQAAMGQLIRGRVVEVNVPHRFIVIDQGLDQGVRVGMTFDVMRGNATVGQAVVVRVRQGISACDLVTSVTSDSIHVSDLTIQRGP